MSYLSYLNGCLIFYFFFNISFLQRYSKAGDLRGLRDMRQIQQGEGGKMGNKGIKATEEIMEETGTSWKVKQKVKLQGGKYLQATKYSRTATCF